MTTEEVGAYWLLLCHQWNAGSIPDEDAAIRRIARVSETFKLDTVRAKFKTGNDGLLRNERMELERKKQSDYRKSRSNNGKLGGRPRKPHGKHMVLKTKAQKSSSSSSSSSDLKERKRKAFEVPNIQQVRLLAEKSGLPESEADKFFYHYDAKGWKVGREPMVSLPSAMGGWATRWRLNGINAAAPPPHTQPELGSHGYPKPPMQ